MSIHYTTFRLFKTSVANKRVGQNFHLFFEDRRKPPLDIAINPDSGTVEYVSYFAQDEKLIVCNIINDIDYKDGLIIIEEDYFDEKNVSISLEKKFKIVKNDNGIFVLHEKILDEALLAYRMDKSNYLLFLKDFEFCGIMMKDISKDELEEIRNSQCL